MVLVSVLSIPIITSSARVEPVGIVQPFWYVAKSIIVWLWASSLRSAETSDASNSCPFDDNTTLAWRLQARENMELIPWAAEQYQVDLRMRSYRWPEKLPQCSLELRKSGCLGTLGLCLRQSGCQSTSSGHLPMPNGLGLFHLPRLQVWKHT